MYLDLVKFLLWFRLAPSASEAKRMIRHGQVSLLEPGATKFKDSVKATERYVPLSDELAGRIKSGERIVIQEVGR